MPKCRVWNINISLFDYIRKMNFSVCWYANWGPDVDICVRILSKLSALIIDINSITCTNLVCFAFAFNFLNSKLLMSVYCNLNFKQRQTEKFQTLHVASLCSAPALRFKKKWFIVFDVLWLEL